MDPGADEASVTHDCLRNTAWPCRHLNSLGEHVFAIIDKPADGWGDLPIGTVFAGGKNGELLEVMEGSSCRKCYHRAGCYFTPNNLAPTCMRDNRNDGQYVCFVKLERTSDA